MGGGKDTSGRALLGARATMARAMGGWLAPLALCCAATQEAGGQAHALDDLLLRYERMGWSGAALVVHGGKTVLARGYGIADPASGRLNDEHTLFELASLTKQFTAAAVLVLVQQEKLELDDSIAEHLPGVPAHSKKITVRQLLTHTSGIPRDFTGGRGDDLEQAVKAYLGKGPANKPGTEFEYWNGGYALLAGIVERVSGRSYMDFCREALFTHAGMQDTGFTGDAQLPAQRASLGTPTSGEPRTALEDPYGSYGWQYKGMGGVVTTVLDLARWDRALAGTSVLGEKAKAELFRVEKNEYACGWYVLDIEGCGVRQSHGGAVRGFQCEMRRYPDHDACIVVLENGDRFDTWRIADHLQQTLFGRPLRDPPPVSIAVAPEELAAYAGTYATDDARLVVRAVKGALELGIEGQGALDALVPWQRPKSASSAEKLVQRTVAMVEEIGRGDAEALRKCMAKRIPDDWPDHVRDTIFPRYAAPLGELKGVTALGARGRGDGVEIVLALAHEHGTGRALVGYSEAGLEHLDWKGPEFPALLRLVPTAVDGFECFERAPFTVRFGRKEERVIALTARGQTYRRE
jgi:CubicO group peptidase (beta-lactamase class C family)